MEVMKNITVLLIIILFTKVYAQIQDNYEPVGPVCHNECICLNQNESLLINCTKKNMNYVLNKWPKHSQFLTASFSYNNISELKQMPPSDAKYISLSFSHCGIKSIASALFIDSVGIQNLDLSWNLLTGKEIHGDVFRGRYSNVVYEPISLNSLDLSYNLIESLPYSTFEHTPHLKQLYLSGNPLKVLDPQTSHAISSILTLEVLHLANNSLKKMPNDVFSRLNKLKELDISENKFQRVPETIEHLSGSLKKLNLGGNLMSVLEDHNFIGLHELRELNISGLSKLTTIRHNTFAYLPKLKILHCENNKQLFQIHEHAFGTKDHIPSLSELYLSNCDLEYLPASLLNWSTLSVISLTENRWLCNCLLFETISIINKTNPNIETSSAFCSLPTSAAATALDDLEQLNIICKNSLNGEKIRYRGYGYKGVMLKFVMVLSVMFLTLIACYVFWKVLVRYNTIRSINTMFPVMYISAPTTEN